MADEHEFSEKELNAILDRLVKGKAPEEIMGQGGLVKDLTRRLVERALEGEYCISAENNSVSPPVGERHSFCGLDVRSIAYLPRRTRCPYDVYPSSRIQIAQFRTKEPPRLVQIATPPHIDWNLFKLGREIRGRYRVDLQCPQSVPEGSHHSGRGTPT